MIAAAHNFVIKLPSANNIFSYSFGMRVRKKLNHYRLFKDVRRDDFFAVYIFQIVIVLNRI